MPLPSNRAIASAAVVLGLGAAAGSARVPPPWDLVLTPVAAILAAIALASALSSRGM